jgi:hypothetical protein
MLSVCLLISLLLLQPALPAPMGQWLTARHPGWQLAPAAPQIVAWFREYGFGHTPNLVAADFDGDGATDYAVHLVARGRAILYVFRAAAAGGQKLAEHAPDPFTFLVLYRKGEKDFDFERMKPFRYQRDSLGLLCDNRTALTFEWNGRRMAGRNAPGDEEVE